MKLYASLSSHLHALLCMGALILASKDGFTQASAASDWLLSIDSSHDSSLVEDASASIPTLLAAAQSGPESEWVTRMEARLARDYDELMTSLTTQGAPGFTTADVEAVRSMSKNDYINGYVSGYIPVYRKRGVQGLAVIGSPAARAALQVLTGSSDAEVRAEAVQAITRLQPGTLGTVAATFTATEAADAITITIARTGGSQGAVSVEYSTVNGTATGNNDFTSMSGKITWGDEDIDVKTVTLIIANDSINEPTESFTFVLSNPTGGAVLGNSSSTVTISDDDAASTGGSGSGGGITPIPGGGGGGPSSGGRSGGGGGIDIDSLLLLVLLTSIGLMRRRFRS